MFFKGEIIVKRKDIKNDEYQLEIKSGLTDLVSDNMDENLKKAKDLMNKRNKLFKAEIASGVSTMATSLGAAGLKIFNEDDLFIGAMCASGVLLVSTFALAFFKDDINYKISYLINDMSDKLFCENQKRNNEKNKTKRK